MTPFGQAMRRLRAERGVSQKEMAGALGVSAAYLSALERGHRGRPGWQFTQRVIGYFNVIWDEAEELEALAELSDPRITIDTAGLPVETILFVNRLAGRIRSLDERTVAAMDALLKEGSARRPRRGTARKPG